MASPSYLFWLASAPPPSLAFGGSAARLRSATWASLRQLRLQLHRLRLDGIAQASDPPILASRGSSLSSRGFGFARLIFVFALLRLRVAHLRPNGFGSALPRWHQPRPNDFVAEPSANGFGFAARLYLRPTRLGLRPVAPPSAQWLRLRPGGSTFGFAERLHLWFRLRPAAPPSVCEDRLRSARASPGPTAHGAHTSGFGGIKANGPARGKAQLRHQGRGMICISAKMPWGEGHARDRYLHVDVDLRKQGINQPTYFILLTHAALSLVLSTQAKRFVYPGDLYLGHTKPHMLRLSYFANFPRYFVIYCRRIRSQN